jgi:hypothetical protein
MPVSVVVTPVINKIGGISEGVAEKVRVVLEKT